MNIGELADAAGVTRRTVRFYVTRQLLNPPEGKARGGYYTRVHLRRLQQIAELQNSGHSLEAIRRIVNGEAAPVEAPRARRGSSAKAALVANFWTRITLSRGLELHINATRSQATVEQLLALRDSARAIMGMDGNTSEQSETESEHPPPLTRSHDHD